MSAKKQKFELPPAIVSSSEDDAPTSPNHDLDEQSESRRLSFGSAIVPSRSSFMSAIADSVAKEDAIAAKKNKAATTTPSSSKKNAAGNKENEREEDEQPPRKSGKSKDGSTAAAAASSEKGKKKATGKVSQGEEEEGQRAECIIGNLPSDLKHIYATTLRRICPEVRTPYPSQMIEDNEDITFVFEIEGKANAKRLRDRIKARQLFGRQVTVDIIPEEKLKCEPVPFAVDICAVPAPDQSEDAPAATPGRHAGAAAKKRSASSAAVSTLSALQIEPALTGMPGFLAVVDSNEHMPEALAAAEDASASKKKASKKRARGGAETTTDAVVPKKFIATFADEGSALHAKAVLSGRRQEGHFLFLNIRRE